MKKVASILVSFVLLMMGVLSVACKAPSVSVTVFEMNGSSVQVVKIKKNEKISLNSPTSKYFDFVGWYINSDCTNEFDKNSKISANTEVYAKWTPKQEELTGIADVAKNIQQIIMVAETDGKNGIDAQILTCQYLRNVKYNSEEWNLLCGIVPYSFKLKIDENYAESAALCERIAVDYGAEEVDFVHFCASLNAVLKNGVNTQISNLCGFVGDLAQVAVLLDGNTNEELYEQAKAIIGAEDNVFSSSDFLADVFAVVVGNAAERRGISFAEILEEYFQKSKIDLIAEFSDVFYDELSKDVISNTTKGFLSGLLVKQWMAQNGGASANAIAQTANAFADYVLAWAVVGQGEE